MKAAASTNASSSTEEAASKKPDRTTGLKLFDVFLYPLLTNFGVFAISVVATYLTSHGNTTGGAVGRFMHRRGEWFMGKAKKLGMSEGAADMSKMVAFSFADGSLMAPLVKVFEDRREEIAQRIDKALGTEPEDKTVYKAEPKQSWLSVLGGRLATVSIVVPTAVVLEKTHFTNKLGQKNNLNNILFRDPGLKMGEWVAKKAPNLVEKFPRLEIPGLFKIGFFEAFYTSVCTAGLYVSSRLFAGLLNKRKDNGVEPVSVPTSAQGRGMEAQGNVLREKPVFLDQSAVKFPTFEEKPRTRIHDVVQAERQATHGEPQLSGI